MIRQICLIMAFGIYGFEISLLGYCDGVRLQLEKSIPIEEAQAYVMPVLYGGRLILANDREISMLDIQTRERRQLLVLNEGLSIVSMDRYKEKLLYVYGDNVSGSELAIYDLLTGENSDLVQLEPNLRKNDMSPAFKGAYWRDENSIIYQVFDSSSGKDQIKAYNLTTKRTTLLKAGKYLSVGDFNRNVGKMLIAAEGALEETEDYVYDTRLRSSTPISEKFRSAAILNSQILIGSDSPSIKGSDIHPFLVAYSHDAVVGPIESLTGAQDLRYSAEQNRLLVLVKEPKESQPYSITVLRVVDDGQLP